MKAELSKFLLSKRQEMRDFISDLSKDFDYVSLLATDVKGTAFVKTTKDSNVSDSSVSERGFVARIYDENFYFEYSFSEWKPKEAAKAIRELASDKKNLKNLKFTKYPVIEEEKLTADYQSELEVHPSELSEAEIFGRMEKIVNSIKKHDKVIEVQLMLDPVNVSKAFVSTNKDLIQSYVYTVAVCVVVVSDGERFKDDFLCHSGRCGIEILDELEKSSEKVLNNALELLKSEPIVPGEYDFICSPEVTGLIAHEAFGHGVEMDMFVKHRAKGAEYLGKEVASKITQMKDGANSIENVSSYFFDDEGTLGGDTKVIKDGILQTGMCDNLSALRLGIKPTGNGKRQSYERKAYTRMTNTFFEDGTDRLEDMISSIENGYLLEGMRSGMEDPKNWGIQCQIARGKEIKDGKLTGKVVAPIVLTGYVPDLLKSISMISKGVEMDGAGFCGKGYKEFVKTSNGGSYIKARGRLG